MLESASRGGVSAPGGGRGCVCSGGCLVPGGVSALGGLLPGGGGGGGGIRACTEADPPPVNRMNDRQV